jgi:hypothetical protein
MGPPGTLRELPPIRRRRTGRTKPTREAAKSFGLPSWTALLPPDQTVYTRRMSLRYARVNDGPDSLFTKEGYQANAKSFEAGRDSVPVTVKLTGS